MTAELARKPGKDELAPLMQSTMIDDPDEIIPPRFSWPLVVSPLLFLVLAVVALVYAERLDWLTLYPIVGLSFILFITSVWHWHRPRFSTRIRRIDYTVVLANVGYASWFSTTLPPKFTEVWFAGLGVVAVIFCSNEYCYYQQVMRNLDGSTSHLKPAVPEYSPATENSQWLTPTMPNTEERNRVYRRTVFVHCIGVHCLAAALALAIITGGARERAA